MEYRIYTLYVDASNSAGVVFSTRWPFIRRWTCGVAPDTVPTWYAIARRIIERRTL